MNNTYTIDSETIVSINKQTVYVQADIWAASSQELPAYDGIKGRVLVPGSIAFVPTESKIFVLDFDYNWSEWDGETEYGVKTAPAKEE